MSIVGFLQTDNNKSVLQATESVSITTGIIAAPITKNAVVVYPNPMSDAANVSIQLLESAQVKFQLVNSLGQTVLTSDLGKVQSGVQEFAMNTTQLSQGIYFLNVLVGNEVFLKKISINR